MPSQQWQSQAEKAQPLFFLYQFDLTLLSKSFD